MRGIFVLDVGNGDMKIHSNMSQAPYVFPSIIGKLTYYDALELNSKNPLANMSVIYEGEEYAIGEMALRNCQIRNHDITDDKYLSESTKILSHAAFSILSDKAYTIGNAIIALPIHKLDISQKVKELYEGKKFGVRIGVFREYLPKINTVELEQALILAQPHGTLFDLILDEHGAISNKQLAVQGLAIFDIGYKTVDGVVFKNLDPVGRLTIHAKNGIYVAYENIRREISKRFSGLEVQPYEIPNIVQNGHLRGIDIRDIINDSFYALAHTLISDIKAKWGGAWEVEKVIFTGGGSALLRPYLQQAFPEAIFVEEPRTANVRGFLKYGKRLWGGA